MKTLRRRGAESALGSRREGQAMVEFTLSLVLFLMLIMGIVDLGRAVWAYNMVSEAARAGARAGLITQTTAAVNAAAQAEIISGAANVSSATITSVFCTSSPGSCSPSDTATYVSVTVSGSYQPVVVKILFPSQPTTYSISFSATSKRYLPS